MERQPTKPGAVVVQPHFHRVRFLSLALSTLALFKIDSELVDSHRVLPLLEGLQLGINATLSKRLPEAVEPSNYNVLKLRFVQHDVDISFTTRSRLEDEES